ncbi:L-lactate dehydrogenase [Anaerococcus sp. AGMB00486]|uniref:L-lactate dehydrogenase n=2 Tax=Anaerococcus TaxID=165779 RepID=A0ABX2N6Z2_9FIRM|nr:MULTISPECIES: L-lactate dehydrogenase [Anaerococcus]MDY3005977.1 L-lactate dehydrogenase [Anaerococcus porci]MSS77086.1 L-lactate dehydrogenase [Anaerococcus porci]NVF10423.1 L-lactate dehydrogenase [Anaerococcus faecalis]
MKDSKVILVGDGAVGSSFAYASTILGIGRELGIIDINEKKAEGDAMDLSDVLSFTNPKQIYKADYSDCEDAEVVVITAGMPQKQGETRLDLIEKNLKIFKDMIGQIVDSGFDGIFLVASNPVDVLTYATWKYSGFPANKVIGTGTTLDSSRFKKEIASLIGIDPRSVDAFIMGEHGDSEFAVWSHTNVGGLPLYEWVKNHSDTDEEALLNTFDKVKNAAYEIIDKKGATFYGIGMALARLVEAIINDTNSVFSTSSYLNGEYGLKDIFIGVPSVIGKDGVKWVIEVPLTDTENERMQKSAEILKDIINKSKL